MPGLLRPRLSIVLILGSYDERTLPVLERVREEIAKLTTLRADVYILPVILGFMEIYRDDAADLTLLVERTADRRLLILVLDETRGVVRDAIQLELPEGMNLDDFMYEFIRRRWPEAKSPYRLPVMEKLEALASHRCLVFVIRHNELTRGGEYIELGFLTGAGLPSRNVYFIHREGIRISEMVYELMDYLGVNLRTYSELEDLLREIRRIIHYWIRRLSRSE